MCRNFVGVACHRGLVEHVLTGSSAEEVQGRLSELVGQPNAIDDELTLWEPGSDGEWQQVNSFNFDEMAWV